MRRGTLIGLALTIPAVLLAADLFDQLGWQQQDFEDTCFQFVSEPGRLPYFHVTPALRALAVARRKAAADAIIARAKAYYASEAFKERWAGQYGSAKQDQQAAQAEAQGMQMANQSIAQMEQMIPMMPPAQQAEMKKAIAKAKADQAKRAGEKKSAASHKDPQVALKKALQHFLEVTDGIDYAAALSNNEGRRTFSNPAYESKSSEWKMAYRAGREATEGARASVKAWIAELK